MKRAQTPVIFLAVLAALAALGLVWLVARPRAFAPEPTPFPVTISSATSGVQHWFVETTQAGGVWLGPETLQAIGLDSQAETPPTLRLSWDSQELPYLLQRGQAGWELFFFAPEHRARYTTRTAYELELGLPGSAMASQTAAPGATAPGLFTFHYEEAMRYLPQATTDSPWFGEALYAPAETTRVIPLPDAAPGPISVTVRLWSHTNFQPYPDHRLRLKWDGAVMGEWDWNGRGMQTFTAAWELDAPASAHELALETPALTDSGIAVVWLDAVDVTYARAPRTGGLYQATGSAFEVPAGYLVLDVSAPLAPTLLESAAGAVETTPGTVYWIGTPEAAPQIWVRPAESLDMGGLAAADYLAIAPAAFHSALQPLLAHRQSQGLVPMLVTPQAIYDTFGAGVPDPAAIQALTRELPALRYLLLVGDASIEPGGYDGDVGALRVVAPLTRTTIVGETAADGWLGADAAGRPVVAVGRLPVTTAEELAALVAKTIAWETADTPLTPLFLNDNEAEFVSTIELMTGLVPGGAAAQRIDMGEAASRETLLQALNQGRMWLNYNGHGSLVRFGDEGVLTVDDGGAWRQTALVTAWSCLAAHYTHPTQNSMAEMWLRQPTGGAVAFLGPVGETTTFEQRPFLEAFYAALAEQPRLGLAWLRALQIEGGSADVRWGFVLLGDPALLVQME